VKFLKSLTVSLLSDGIVLCREGHADPDLEAHLRASIPDA